MSRKSYSAIVGILAALGLAASASAVKATHEPPVTYYGAPYHVPYGMTYYRAPGYAPHGTTVYYGPPYYYGSAGKPVYYYGPRYHDPIYYDSAGTTVFFGTKHQLPEPYYQREVIEGAPD